MIPPCLSCDHQAFIKDNGGHYRRVCLDLAVRGRYAVIMNFSRLPKFVIEGIAAPICRRISGVLI